MSRAFEHCLTIGFSINDLFLAKKATSLTKNPLLVNLLRRSRHEVPILPLVLHVLRTYHIISSSIIILLVCSITRVNFRINWVLKGLYCLWVFVKSLFTEWNAFCYFTGRRWCELVLLRTTIHRRVSRLQLMLEWLSVIYKKRITRMFRRVARRRARVRRKRLLKNRIDVSKWTGRCRAGTFDLRRNSSFKSF